MDNTDEILGITRCARCGHRLDGNVECPFCAAVYRSSKREAVPKWVFMTACFLTSPVSLPAILKTERLGTGEKFLTFSGCLLWVIFFGVWF